MARPPKKPSRTEPPKPRNPEARALRSGLFKPKAEPKKDAYRRKPKHARTVIVEPDDDGHGRDD